MSIKTVNPKNDQVLKEYSIHSNEQVKEILLSAESAFGKWRIIPFEFKVRLFESLEKLLIEKKRELGELITNEMGKPVSESIAEIVKCASVCEYYRTHGSSILKEETISSDATNSYVRFEPLGVIFAIMPWNFPFWQVFRFAVPSIIAGNTVVLKHASNVTGCAYAIKKLFDDAGFPSNVFNVIVIDNSSTETVISNSVVKAVTLTGSEGAGSAVASVAGKYLKKCVLELGGSDPFIVLKDADLEFTVENAIKSRFLNSGQSCIAAKRFIVHTDVYDRFLALAKTRIEQLKVADPLKDDTEIGPIARQDLMEQILNTISTAVNQGAELILGGERVSSKGFFLKPTLLANVKSDMITFKEEVFGPVLSVSRFSSNDEAVALANSSKYGLGASIWTKDVKTAIAISKEIESGQVYINGIVKSDPRLPFGGVKNSGYGRELSGYGLKEFMNIKTVWIK